MVRSYLIQISNLPPLVICFEHVPIEGTKCPNKTLRVTPLKKQLLWSNTIAISCTVMTEAKQWQRKKGKKGRNENKVAHVWSIRSAIDFGLSLISIERETVYRSVAFLASLRAWESRIERESEIQSEGEGKSNDEETIWGTLTVVERTRARLKVPRVLTGQ